MTTSSLSLDNLAMQASEQSGLPQPFVKALIAEEGTWNQGSGNPFDITNIWANETGFGDFVIGLWNHLGDWGGVAIFDDASAAIQSWAKGILTFSAYDVFRKDAASGASARQLAQDLADAGYAGNPSDSANFVNNVSALYEQYSGLSALDPIASKDTPSSTQVTAGATYQEPGQQTSQDQGQTQGQQTQATATALAKPWGDVSVTNPFANIANAVTDLGSIPAKALADVERFLWIALGLILALAGLWVLVESGKKGE